MNNKCDTKALEDSPWRGSSNYVDTSHILIGLYVNSLILKDYLQNFNFETYTVSFRRQTKGEKEAHIYNLSFFSDYLEIWLS